MTVARMLGRLTASLILTLSLTSLAFAHDRADAGRTETGVSMVPSVHAPPAQVGPLTDAATLGGAVPWATIAPPPAWGEAGGSGATLVQGGGGGTPQLRYYALDALGSVRVVFDAAGAVVSRADYEPFGAAVPASTTGTLPRQQFTGQERDGEVGVDYFGARLYVPQHGRMPSVDPLYVGAVAEPQRWNRYAYALNAPVHLVDPDGRQARSCSYHVGVVWFDGYWFDTGYFSMSCSNSNPRGGLYDSGTELPGSGNGGSGTGGSSAAPAVTQVTTTTTTTDPPKPEPPGDDRQTCVPRSPEGYGPRIIAKNAGATATSNLLLGPQLTAALTINKVRPGGAWDYAGARGEFQDFGRSGNSVGSSGRLRGPRGG
jgi:RHS repeat-associated protein